MATTTVAALKTLVQEQAETIADLKTKLAAAESGKKSEESTKMTYYKENQELLKTIEQAHDLMDAQAGVLPREVTRKNSWGGEEKDKQDLIVRMASWIGACASGLRSTNV